jgi:hypothetical protein
MTVRRTREGQKRRGDRAGAVSAAVRDSDSDMLPAVSSDLGLDEVSLGQGAVYRAEINLLRYPWYVISRKNPTGTITFSEKIRRPDGTVVEASWEVISDAKLGLPNAWDADVRRLIDEMMSQLPRPVENPICLGSIAEILDALGRANTGPNNRAVKNSLRRLVSTTIHSSGSYYDKKRKRWLEESFHILERVTFKGERFPDGSQADAVYVTVSRPYLDNFNANYTIPLDWAYQKRVLKLPTTKRLYELLNQIFYRECRRRERAGERLDAEPVTVECRYSRLAALAPLTQFRQLWAVKNQLDPSHGELIESEYLVAPVLIEEVGAGRTLDFIVTYGAGPRAIAEYECAATGGMTLGPAPRSVAASTRRRVVRSELAAPRGLAPPRSPAANDWPLGDRLVEFGLSRDVAEELLREFGVERVATHLDAMPFRKHVVNPQGYLIRAIRSNWSVPPDALRAAGGGAERLASAASRGDFDGRRREPTDSYDAPEPATVDLQEPGAGKAWAELVADVSSVIAATLGQVVADKIVSDWLKPIVAMRQEGSTLKLRVPNATYTRFLTSRSSVSNVLRERADAHGVTLHFDDRSGRHT